MVERLGCRVEAVRNGREAIEALDYDRHDLVLMDVQMPEMDGFTATAAIREREQDTGRHIPIIAMTAHAMQGDRERCLAAGMDGYLSKPIRPGPLREALLAWGAEDEQPSDGAGRRQEPEFRSFSAAILGESCGNDPKLTCEVLGLMLKGVPVRLERLEAAVGRGDGRQVSWEAHGLKGDIRDGRCRSLGRGLPGVDDARRTGGLRRDRDGLSTHPKSMGAASRKRRAATSRRLPSLTASGAMIERRGGGRPLCPWWA